MFQWHKIKFDFCLYDLFIFKNLTGVVRHWSCRTDFHHSLRLRNIGLEPEPAHRNCQEKLRLKARNDCQGPQFERSDIQTDKVGSVLPLFNLQSLEIRLSGKTPGKGATICSKCPKNRTFTKTQIQ